VSGLLSGVLLSCAFYGIIRFHTLTEAATGTDFSSNLLIAFGVLSVAVAVPFVLLARDIKRMLAYSSIEHLGLMALAVGVGGPVAITAGLLHLVNHAAAKGMLFFVVGDIVHRYGGVRRIRAIRGALRAAPASTALFLVGVLAITGAPPFGIFATKLGIVGAALAGRPFAVASAVAVLLLLGVIFGGLLRHALAMAYGGPPNPVPSPGGDRPLGLGWSTAAGLAPLLLVMVLFGLYVPGPVATLLREIVAIVEPASQAVASR
jgi:hydrogenase-4 component F